MSEKHLTTRRFSSADRLSVLEFQVLEMRTLFDKIIETQSTILANQQEAKLERAHATQDINYRLAKIEPQINFIASARTVGNGITKIAIALGSIITFLGGLYVWLKTNMHI